MRLKTPPKKSWRSIVPPAWNDQGYAWFAGPGLSLSRRAAADQALRASRFLKSVAPIRVAGRAGNELDRCQFASKNRLAISSGKVGDFLSSMCSNRVPERERRRPAINVDRRARSFSIALLEAAARASKR